MPLCVEESGGFIVTSAETYPACSQFALVGPAQLERLTYFADLSVALDPSGDSFWPLATAMLLAYGAVAGIRLLLRNMQIENKHI